MLNSCIVTATSGAFIRLLTSFITSALFSKCPTVRAIAAIVTKNYEHQNFRNFKQTYKITLRKQVRKEVGYKFEIKEKKRNKIIVCTKLLYICYSIVT